MKFREKFKNFKRNLIYSQKYQIFLAKRDFVKNKTENFFLNKLQLRYALAFWFYYGAYFKSFSKWLAEIFINGSLIYIAYTGIIKPLNFVHQIFAFGLCLYIPITLIRKAYSRVSMEKRLNKEPMSMRMR